VEATDELDVADCVFEDCALEEDEAEADEETDEVPDWLASPGFVTGEPVVEVEVVAVVEEVVEEAVVDEALVEEGEVETVVDEVVVEVLLVVVDVEEEVLVVEVEEALLVVEVVVGAGGAVLKTRMSLILKKALVSVWGLREM